MPVHRQLPQVVNFMRAKVGQFWRALKRTEGIYLQRVRGWCVSTDKEFIAKSVDIIGLYLNPPVNAVVLSVDEKPSMQAIERLSGYVETKAGAIVRGVEEHLQTSRRIKSIRRSG